MEGRNYDFNDAMPNFIGISPPIIIYIGKFFFEKMKSLVEKFLEKKVKKKKKREDKIVLILYT